MARSAESVAAVIKAYDIRGVVGDLIARHTGDDVKRHLRSAKFKF